MSFLSIGGRRSEEALIGSGGDELRREYRLWDGVFTATILQGGGGEKGR